MATLLHWARWSGWTTLFFTLTGCATTMDKFDWGASESAPGEYPMEILTAKLHYQEPGKGLSVPNRVTLYGSHQIWGRGRSTHVSGPEFKPLPARLEIKFFSYAENQFYIGSFELPYERILALFRQGYYTPGARHRWVLLNNDGYRKRHRKLGLANDHSPYNGILVGITPGGGVAVWVEGTGATTEVFFGQAEKADLDWKLVSSNPGYYASREDFVERTMQESLAAQTPESRAALQAANGVIPLQRWAGYRTRYPWHPVFTNMATREGEALTLHSFNGERIRIAYPVAQADLTQTRVVPESMGFIWMQSKTQGLIFDLKFDEAEIFAAFKQLGSRGEALQLEMRMDPVVAEGVQKLRFSAWLRNSREAVELKKAAYTNQKKEYPPSPSP